MKITDISLRKLLPNVFRGMENSDAIRNSQVWEVDNLTLNKGERYCIRAESGGGKSSLLSFIYGNRSDYKGLIDFNKRNIRELSVKDWCDIRTHNLALLPQEMRLFPELTAMQNVVLKNMRSNYKSEKEIKEMFEQLGIADKLDSPAALLSIGQQQRVAIIRTLCQPFDFILLDEPVSHLDDRNNKIVAGLVTQEAEKSGAGIISTSVGHHLMLENAIFIDL